MTRVYRYQDYFPNQDYRLKVSVMEVTHPTIARHAHEFSELVVILGGGARHWINGEEYMLTGGDVFVIKGHDAHAYYEATGLRVCNILYDPGQFLTPRGDVQRLPGYHALFYLEPIYRSRDQFRSRLRLDRGQMRWLADMIERMERESREAAIGHETMLASMFIEVVVYLSRLYSYQRDPASQEIMRLSKVITYLEEHYQEPLRLDDLAELTRMSKNNLLRVFRQCYKTTPGDYLIRLRFTRACEMMRDPRKTLSEIAYECGFSDSNYFSRQFRKLYGQSPRDFRQTLLATTVELRHVRAQPA